MTTRGFNMSPNDMENGAQRYMEFEDNTIRRKFIKKVYLILAVQLLVTLGCTWALISSDTFNDYIDEHPILFFVAVIVIFVTMIVLACCTSVRRTSPLNYICLGIFTLAQTFLLAVVATRYEPQTVLLSVALTALICIVLSLYAMQTKFDFTLMGGFLLVSLIVGLVFGILMIFFHSRIAMMIYCSLGIILYSLFLIYDTQLMVGGNHAYVISPDEPIFAALNLYIDIIQILLCLLHLIGSDN